MTSKQITIELGELKDRLQGVLEEFTEVSLEVCYRLEPENCSDEDFAAIRDNRTSDAARCSIEDAIEYIEEELGEGSWKEEGK